MLLKASFLKLGDDQVDTFLHLQHHCHRLPPYHRLPSNVHLCISVTLQNGIEFLVITSMHTHRFSGILCKTISLDVVIKNI